MPYYLTFDGVDDNVDFGNVASIKPSNKSFSWEIKFRTTSTGTWRMMDSRGTGSLGAAKGLQISHYSSHLHWGNLVLDGGSSIKTISMDNAQFNEADGKWHTLKFDFDNSLGKATLFIDGVKKGEKTNSNLIGADFSNTLPLVLATNANGKNTQNFLGDIDFVRVYENGVLVSDWQMDEGSGTTVYESVNGNNGTIYGAIWNTDQTSLSYDVKTVLYATKETSYDLMQSIFASLSNSIDTRMILYAGRSSIFDTRQSIFDSGATSISFDLKQVIYHASQVEGDTHLVVYADTSINTELQQLIYQDNVLIFDTQQTHFDPNYKLIGKIRLDGKRTLHVYLKGVIPQ